MEVHRNEAKILKLNETYYKSMFDWSSISSPVRNEGVTRDWGRDRTVLGPNYINAAHVFEIVTLRLGLRAPLGRRNQLVCRTAVSVLNRKTRA